MCGASESPNIQLTSSPAFGSVMGLEVALVVYVPGLGLVMAETTGAWAVFEPATARKWTNIGSWYVHRNRDRIAGRAGHGILDVVDRAAHVVEIAHPVSGSCQDVPGVSAAIGYSRLRHRLAVEIVIISQEQQQRGSSRIDKRPGRVRCRIGLAAQPFPMRPMTQSSVPEDSPLAWRLCCDWRSNPHIPHKRSARRYPCSTGQTAWPRCSSTRAAR